MTTYRDLLPPVVAQAGDDNMGPCVDESYDDGDNNNNETLISRAPFAQVVPRRCNRASNFFLDAVPPRDHTARRTRSRSHQPVPPLHDSPYSYNANLKSSRHYFFFFFFRRNRVFTRRRLENIHLLASSLIIRIAGLSLSSSPSAYDSSASLAAAAANSSTSTDMPDPQLLKAFQDEYDRQERCGCWPSEYTDAILHLRQPRERGAREARECLMKARSEGRVRVEEASFPRAAPRTGIIKVTTVCPRAAPVTPTADLA
ncbi:hypothetical protein PG988_008353 [Apiospora saccharicola]